MTNLAKIVEMLAKQATGGQQQQPNNQGLGGVIGSVLGQLTGQNQNNSTHQNQGQSQQDQSQSGLGGILTSVLAQLGGRTAAGASRGGGNTKAILIAVLPIVLAWIQKNGGIEGALSKLKSAGLNRQVDDWVDTGAGENLPVDANQVQSLFNEQEIEQEIEQVAQETATPKQDIYGAIAGVLPQIIDALTPQGQKTNQQEANNDIQDVLNLVSGFLKR